MGELKLRAEPFQTGRAAGPTPLNALGDNVLTTTLDKVINWGRSSAIWPALFGLACCAIEMMGAVGPRQDISRFGSELFRASPRQSDLLIVSGRVAIKMVPVIRQVYDQMPEPKWVIAMGACASSAGMFPSTFTCRAVPLVRRPCWTPSSSSSARSAVNRWSSVPPDGWVVAPALRRAR